jgi:hypothetical protein
VTGVDRSGAEDVPGDPVSGLANEPHAVILSERPVDLPNALAAVEPDEPHAVILSERSERRIVLTL